MLPQCGQVAPFGHTHARSFWMDSYVEERVLADIREGDPATMGIMGFEPPLIRGHVQESPSPRPLLQCRAAF